MDRAIVLMYHNIGMDPKGARVVCVKLNTIPISFLHNAGVDRHNAGRVPE
jgi:hypothetical protein